MSDDYTDHSADYRQGLTDTDGSPRDQDPPEEQPAPAEPATIAFATGQEVTLHHWNLDAFGPDSAIEWLLYGRVDPGAAGPEGAGGAHHPRSAARPRTPPVGGRGRRGHVLRLRDTRHEDPLDRAPMTTEPPLAHMRWIEQRPCGCITAGIVADWGDGVHLFPTLAEVTAHHYPMPSDRLRAAELGLTLRLVTARELRDLHGGGRWNCADHTVQELMHGPSHPA
ncbi:hypothetical protein ACXKR8_042745 [Streptacidiphilus sp. PAMC 29251]